MKKRRRQAIGNYVRHIGNEMGLRDWHFDIVFPGKLPASVLNEDDEFAGVASCTSVPGQKRATIAFVENFQHLPDEAIREVVVHELLHCHLAQMYEWGRHATLEHLSQSAYNVFMFGFATAWETAIDGMARPWAESMPLIDWELDGPATKET